MNKRGQLKLKFSLTVILITIGFFLTLWIFPVNPENISGSLVKYDIIKAIEPKSNSETQENSIKIIVTTEKSAICKSSRMKGSTGYYPPYTSFQRTNDYYHETQLYLDEGRNNFKIYCRQIGSDVYDYNYWSIKRL